ncbi:MAG: 3-hydroxyacyl-CoA dehydrogenase NAD-binding domain-containing protein [Halobacteriota archaeon]|nr:3-hydroxyacyl-CoA dehydrogenase NAD-binding domain-containing protein [Halobacteriota archaeon]
MKLDEVEKVAIIGSGAMGHGIAQVCAMGGYRVVMKDIKEEFLENGVAKIRESLDIMVRKEKITPSERDNILNNLLTTTLDTTEAVSDAQIIIEAVPEVMGLKKTVFSEVSDAASEDSILASNTSSMSITEIASAVKSPARFAGMHFFNPVNRMKLVEIIYGKETSHECVELLIEFSKLIGKIPVKVLKDSPGFIVNRIAAPNQALASAILDEGMIKPDALDTAMKRMNMPMGLFELMDYVGIDVFYHVMSYFSETLSPEYAPGKVLKGLIEKGDLGMKTGKGIYSWEGGKAQIDTSCKEKLDISPMGMIAIQINEAVRVYKEGVVESIDDIDLAVKYGLNAATGPFAIASSLKAKQLSKALNNLQKRYKLDIFKPEPEIENGLFKTLGR